MENKIVILIWKDKKVSSEQYVSYKPHPDKTIVIEFPDYIHTFDQDGKYLQTKKNDES